MAAVERNEKQTESPTLILKHVPCRGLASDAAAESPSAIVVECQLRRRKRRPCVFPGFLLNPRADGRHMKRAIIDWPRLGSIKAKVLTFMKLLGLV